MIVVNMKNLGINLPPPRIHPIPFEKAPDQLELCKDMIDVMQCDVTSDGKIAAKALEFKLSHLNEAIKVSVEAKLFPKRDHSEKKQ